MHIRTAQQSDLEALLDIYNYEVVNGVSTLDLQPRTLEERQIWFDEHNKDNHPLIVAEIDGKTVGYATLSPYRTKEAYKSTVELSVYVQREYRRQGIATALMKEILKTAREDEITHTVVSVITSENTGSAELHKKFGFSYCGTIPEVGFKLGRYISIDNYYLIV